VVARSAHIADELDHASIIVARKTKRQFSRKGAKTAKKNGLFSWRALRLGEKLCFS
jgi:hypothetical protein